MVGIFSQSGKRTVRSQKGTCNITVQGCSTQTQGAHKSIFYVLTIALLALFLVGCSTQTNSDSDSDSFTVAVSFFPYYEFTRAVIGDSGEVYVIVPASVEPHDYEPSIRDIERLQNARALVVSGTHFESYEDQFEANVRAGTVIIHASEGLHLLEGVHHSHDDDHTDDDSDGSEDLDSHDSDENVDEYGIDVHDYDNDGRDPHVWVSLQNAMVITQNIADELSEARPELASVYQQNAALFIAEVASLEAEYARVLATCEHRDLFVTHNAFAYLARDYDLEVISISGLSHDVEPSPQQLAELIEEARYHGVRAIFSEELVSDSVAQTIANEVGASVLVLSDMSGSPRGLSYLDLLKENLNNLKRGLVCNG
jgi:zinc transport system substrate-binding protein